MRGDDVTNSGKGSGWRWPAIVVGLLATHVVLMMAAVMFIRARTPSLGIVPDYYDKAVNWDKEQGVLRASREMGWTVAVEPAGAVDALGRREVTLVLRDAGGKAVEGASLEVTYFHHAQADRPDSVSFAKADVGGRYTKAVRMPREGFYDFRVTATAGERTFVSTMTQWVGNDGAAATSAAATRKGPA